MEGAGRTWRAWQIYPTTDKVIMKKSVLLLPKQVAFLLVSLVCVFGCTKPEVHRKSEVKSRTSVSVLFLSETDHLIESTNPDVVARVQEWVRQVSHTQPPPEEIGSVSPWCTITVWEIVESKRNLLFEKDVYRFKDSKGTPLLNNMEQDNLRRILETK
jgi:hypothetical protein